MTKALKMINMYIYIGWEKGQWETGHLKNFHGRRYTLFSRKWDILFSGNDCFLWELDHLSSGNRTTYPLGFRTSSGKLDMRNGTRYSLGFGPLILWKTSSGNREFGNLFLTVILYMIMSRYFKSPPEWFRMQKVLLNESL